MGKVFANISMSLDGFSAGVNDGVDVPMGVGGEQLHHWMFSIPNAEDHPDALITKEVTQNLGAVIIGRRMFNNGEKVWGDESPFSVPVFVVTHQSEGTVTRNGGASFHLINGIENALSRARAIAGDQNIWVGGGASIVQQFIAAGLLDEIQINLVPIFLGDGVRLFDHAKPAQLEQIRVIQSPVVSHLKYRVIS